jgi:hypothetical protein
MSKNYISEIKVNAEAQGAVSLPPFFYSFPDSLEEPQHPIKPTLAM